MDKTIIHFEIPADDVKKLSNFYEKLFCAGATHLLEVYMILFLPMWILRTR
jgi:predicted enzyme related to lactoylglutathione lyase